MKLLMSLVVLGYLLLPGTTNSQQTSAPTLSTYHVLNVEDSVMQKIAEKFEVTRKLQNGYEVLVPVDQNEDFLKLSPSAQLIEEDSTLSIRNLEFGVPLDQRQYQLFPQILEKLKTLESQNPDLVQYVEYGKSADGRPLFAIKISDNVTLDEDEPELMITATTHGDEIITTEVALGLMDKLVDGYLNQDSRIQNMVNDHELYFIPVVNADGFVNRVRYDKGKDPNRSYPYPGNPDVKSTASISALINFFKSRNFVGSLDFHAYGELTMYPWAYTYESVPENDRLVFDDLAKRMAKTNNYIYGPISKVIYVAVGSSADYYYWTKGTIALAIEVGLNKAPNPNQIDSYINEQIESTWLFIENF